MKYCIVLLAAILASLTSVAQGNCPEEWTEWNGHCYRYMSQFRKTWAAASDDCKTATPEGNGHLLTIDSEEENKFACDWWVKMMKPLIGKWQYIWIGLNDIEKEDNFVWEDGSPVTYTNWGGNQPDNRFNNSNCATMAIRKVSDKGKWDDARCFGRRAYICEYTCHNCA